tara:strand:+ start:287 stop:445 length:159 start_codon:yes stop_codon:yes gene_type:complete
MSENGMTYEEYALKCFVKSVTSCPILSLHIEHVVSEELKKIEQYIQIVGEDE